MAPMDSRQAESLKSPMELVMAPEPNWVASPATVIAEALRVGRALTVGFVNYGYWKNRCDVMLRGRKPRNEVFNSEWADSRPSNPVTVADFEIVTTPY